MAGLLVVAAVPSAARAVPEAETKPVAVVVKSGDTLLRIAARHGVSVEDLRRWNAKRIGKGDMIRAGDKLVVRLPALKVEAVSKEGPVWEGWYDIQPGDTLGRVAESLGVAVEDLERWNRLRPGGVIRAGQMLRYEKRGPAPEPHSHGRPTDGRLSGGVHLGKGSGYRLRFPDNAFGIPRVRETLRRCAAETKRAFPGTADVLIGDLSRPRGGRFPPHVSHQSGRDVDVGYYLTGNKQNATMYRLHPSEVDLKKTWSLLRCFLATDRVVRVYMDGEIQKLMAKRLLARGLATEAQIDHLFEARSQRPEAALIRHAGGHDTHLHVRFACDKDDGVCVEEDDDHVFTLVD